ncbi:MAG: hypothetical protein VKK62_05910 [Synechococcaceae cyanobacterium]|nr:hypothetical protein [Synechococcaceae cyanobacterium]
MLALSGLLSGNDPALAAEQRMFPLQCRLGNGPWTACAMEVEQIGLEWQLVIGGRRIRFRHDPRGPLRMQEPGRDWRSVDSRWEDSRDLCWDGVCARGDIPLD